MHFLGFLVFNMIFQLSNATELNPDNSQRIGILKSQIKSIALSNITNVETRQQTRQQLDPLIEEIGKLAGPVTEKAWMDFAPGSWQQIWSDERDNSPPGAPAQDYSKIFQYISVQGWGFNFGERIVAPGQSVTFALSVIGSIQQNEQTTEITGAYARMQGLQTGESIGELSHKIKTGAESGFEAINAGRFPQGPIGAKGVLNLIYLDETLKVGYAANVYTGDKELFILRRLDRVGEEALQLSQQSF
ncbi:MAG: hypothetical protein ACK5V3_18345 [Bdellovibrionales bacterium]